MQSLGIPISAMRLLSTIARIFPMSLLACLGSDAEAIRDILIFRLESQTEDVKLKVAIIGMYFTVLFTLSRSLILFFHAPLLANEDFFSACVESQPGFIQLLIGAKNVQMLNVNAGKERVGGRDLTKEEKEQNEKISLVSESGCLDPILQLLKESREKNLNELHLATVTFVLNLWMHCRVIAITHLKTRDFFWTDLTWPLFQRLPQAAEPKRTICAAIFRIISSEIYICGGKVDGRLMTVLEKFTEEKEDYFSMWCGVALESIFNTTTGASSMFAKLCDNSESNHVALLAAWKSFLVVLTKDQPTTLSPVQCRTVSSKLVATVKRLVSSINQGGDDDYEVRVLTSLAGTRFNGAQILLIFNSPIPVLFLYSAIFAS